MRGRELPYDERTQHLAQTGIALWDVVASAERPGSLDSSIVQSSVIVNDFRGLFQTHHKIKLVCLQWCESGGALSAQSATHFGRRTQAGPLRTATVDESGARRHAVRRETQALVDRETLQPSLKRSAPRARTGVFAVLTESGVRSLFGGRGFFSSRHFRECLYKRSSWPGNGHLAFDQELAGLNLCAVEALVRIMVHFPGPRHQVRSRQTGPGSWHSLRFPPETSRWFRPQWRVPWVPAATETSAPKVSWFLEEMINAVRRYEQHQDIGRLASNLEPKTTTTDGDH